MERNKPEEEKMEQLPMLIVRGRYFSAYKKLAPEIREQIELEMAELIENPDIKRHINDAARVYSRTIGGEYKDRLEAGQQEALVALWKAITSIHLDKKTFKNKEEMIRMCSTFMNNFIKQSLSENKRKKIHTMYKYSGVLSEIVHKATIDYFAVGIEKIGEEHSLYDDFVKFIDTNFGHCGISVSGNIILIESDYKTRININKPKWVIQQSMEDLNNTQSYQDENLKQVDDEEFVEKMKSPIDNEYNIIIRAIMDETIMSGKKRLTPGVVANFLKRQGIKCNKTRGRIIIGKMTSRMVDIGVDDNRLYEYIAN